LRAQRKKVVKQAKSRPPGTDAGAPANVEVERSAF